MTRELQRISLIILIGFAVAASSTFFWTTIQRDSLLAREDNPRKVLTELNIQRGRIYDRDGTLLAYTEAASDPTIGPSRVYPFPETVSAVGYYSFNYGQSGLEEGYNDLLRASHLRDTSTTLRDALFNRNIVGGDLRSTLDLQIQQALANAMQGHLGAGIVARVPSGEVLAMISLPAYDPNQIDIIGKLANPLDDGTPRDETIKLLNRVIDGRYQPGGAIQTLILSAMLASGSSPDSLVAVGDIQLAQPALYLTCAIPTPESQLSLSQAYLRGCPAPFWTAPTMLITSATFEGTLKAAGLWDAPKLGGFLLPTNPKTPFTPYSDATDINADAVGQGRLTVTPLQMLQVMASVVNTGNGVELHLDDAIRYPSDSEWVEVPPFGNQLAIMQPAIAQTIEALLSENSFDPTTPVFGHVSRALAGSREYAWFLGWTPLADGSKAVIVLVLEATSVDPIEAAQVAVPVLRAAYDEIQ